MGDLENVMDALRKADEAGNVEDAQKLAEMASRLSQQPKESSGVMPFANKAIASTLGAPVDLITAGANLIPGVDIKEPVGGSKNIERGMEAIGIDLPEGSPETLPEYIGTGIGEVSSLMLPVGMATKALSKGAGLVGRVANSVWQNTIRHPYLAMTSELTGGAGAGAGRSTEGGPVAEMAGGVAGSMAPTLALHAPTMIALRQGKNILRKVSMPFTEGGAKYRAGEFLKGQVSAPGEVAAKAGEETIGSIPPVIQSGEKKLMTLYKSFIGQDPVADADTIETLSKSMITLEKEMRKLGYGSPELLAEITEKRVAALELRIDNRVMKATETAQQKLDALPVAERKVAESRIVRTELESAMRAEKQAESALWQRVSKDYPVGFESTRNKYNSLMDDLPTAQRTDVPAVLRKTDILHNEKIDGTTIREMQGLRSKLLETSRVARKNGQWNKARIANDVADSILEDIGISAEGAATPEAADLQAALAATKQFKTRFESGITGKILGYDKSGAPAISPDLTLDISVGRMGQKGSIDISKVAVTPEAKAATERYLSRSYVDYATNKTGKIDPIKSERWVKNNEAILDQFPSLKDQFSDAAKAQEMADTVTDAMKQRRQALRDPKISTSAKFLNSADLGVTVETILKSNKPAIMTNELIRQAAKDQSGEALEGLRGAFVDHILEKSAIGSFNELGEQTLSGRALLSFVNKNGETLNQLFTIEQMQRMKVVGTELAKIESFDKIHAGKPDIEMQDVASTALRLFSRVGGAQIGRWVAKVTGGGTVQTPGIFSERFKVFANYLAKDRSFQMLHDAVLSNDPKMLQSLLLPIDKPGTQKNNLRLLNERMNLWLGGTGKRVMDEIAEEIESDKGEE